MEKLVFWQPVSKRLLLQRLIALSAVVAFCLTLLGYAFGVINGILPNSSVLGDVAIAFYVAAGVAAGLAVALVVGYLYSDYKVMQKTSTR